MTHYHGNFVHDHDGGDAPHDHAPPDTRSPYRGEAMLVWGILIAIFGGVGLLWQASPHSACGNVLVRAAATEACSEADLIWTAGLIGLILGVALFIAGAVMRSRS